MARIGITIPQNLLIQINYYSQAYGYTRSEFLRHAVRELIKQKEDYEDQLFQKKRNSKKLQVEV